MNKRAISSTNAPNPAGAYSPAIASGDLLFTSGFGPQHPTTGEIGRTVGEQTRQTLRNIESVLKEAGISMSDVVKTTVHLQNLKVDFAEFNSAYSDFFEAPLPARTTVGSDLFDILVEIDVVARMPAL